MNDNLEARVERLEDFIGNIDQIRLYANSLQQVIDKYLAPLYVESGSNNIMLIDGYLGALNDIPHNVIFKIRASHDLVMQPSDEHAIIRFKRGQDYVDYTLRKMVDNILVRLDSDNYTAGEVYDIYINSQDVAIITANDTGVRALSELNAYKTANNARVTALEGTVSSNYTTLDTKIDNTLTAAKSYTDAKDSATNTRVDDVNTFLSGIGKSGNDYTFTNNIIAPSISTAGLNCTGTINMSGASGFVLPSGTTIADPSTNLGLANRQWVTSQINTAISNYHAEFHYVGTAAASSAMAGKENGSFYYKLSN